MKLKLNYINIRVIKVEASICLDLRLSTKSPTLLAVFLCVLSAGTALACSLRLVIFPWETSQITANIKIKILLIGFILIGDMAFCCLIYSKAFYNNRKTSV
ncbi:hypothetical protein BU115_03885 [Staphylococcus xylosus]|nr:hypothetical protein BU115_03885 [Staphylococcus xylosus]